LNLSLGVLSGNRYDRDRLAGAVERAWKAGIVVVAAGGNDGNSTTQLNDPAYDPYVVAVGAADTKGTLDHGDDTVSDFSAAGSSTRTPDLVAPGVQVESLRVPGSVIDATVGVREGADPRFVRGSGTSQAAAVVSGLAAIVVQSRPTWTPDMVKSVLVAMTKRLGVADASLQGYGEVDLAHTGPYSAWIGTQDWRMSRLSSEVSSAADGTDTTLTSTDDLANQADTSGVRWNGVRWSGVRWSGVRWSGVRWS
jgi:serine protease AprX